MAAEIQGIEFEVKGSSDKATAALDRLSLSLARIKTAASNGGAKAAARGVKDVGKSAEKANSPLKTFLSSLKRIAFYRILRGILKNISQGFQEGLKNAYQFSKINGGALAESLDTIATKSLTMKNQLGAAFGGLLTALTPVILSIISLVTRLASALSMVIAALGGSSQYKKAKDVWTEWGEEAKGAGGKAKEALRYLAPFDELNRLPDENKGGGGGSQSPDYGEMFEYADVPDWLKGLTEKFSDFASSLSITFSDVFFKWDNLTGEQIAEKVITGLGALLGAGVGFMLGGVPGALIGTLAGATIGLEISSLIFDHDGVISQNEVAELINGALAALCGGIIGFVVGGPGGALIGATLGVGAFAVLKGIEFQSDGKSGDLTGKLSTALGALAGAVIGFQVGGPAGALLGATVGLGISFAIKTFAFADTSEWTTGEWVSNIVATLAPFAGAAIGLVVGGPAGALIGATIGLGIHFALTQETGDAGKSAGATFFDNLIQSAKDGWTLARAWFSDNFVRGLQQIGINAANGLAKKIADGINKIIEKYNNIAEFFGWKTIDPIEIKLIPDLDPPPGTFYDQTKKQIEARNALNKLAMSGEINQVDPRLKDKPSVETIAQLNETKDAIPQNKRPSLKTTARLASVSDGLSSKDKTVNTTANFNSRTNSLSDKEKQFATVADFKSRVNDLSDNAKKFDTVANFNSRLNGLSDKEKQFNTVANFNSKKNSLGTPSFSSLAAINSYKVNDKLKEDGYFSLSAKVNITGQTNTPTLKAKVQWTGTTEQVANGGAFFNNAWHSIPQYANGGRPHGSLFVAGEAGPEIVGHVGGRTEVLNKSQIAATMYSAVVSAMSGLRFAIPSYTGGDTDVDTEDMMYRAFSRALSETDFGGDIELDGDTLYRKMVSRNRQNTRLTGVNAMA